MKMRKGEEKKKEVSWKEEGGVGISYSVQFGEGEGGKKKGGGFRPRDAGAIPNEAEKEKRRREKERRLRVSEVSNKKGGILTDPIFLFFAFQERVYYCAL